MFLYRVWILFEVKHEFFYVWVAEKNFFPFMLIVFEFISEIFSYFGTYGDYPLFKCKDSFERSVWRVGGEYARWGFFVFVTEVALALLNIYIGYENSVLIFNYGLY
jgi:hypothetical protein